MNNVLFVLLINIYIVKEGVRREDIDTEAYEDNIKRKKENRRSVKHVKVKSGQKCWK